MTEAPNSKAVPQMIQDLTQFYLDKYNMDYEIISIPDNLTITEGDKVIPINSDYYNLINTQTLEKINSVKKGYTISQTREVLEMVLMGMREFDGLEVAKFTDINGGRKTFIQLKIDGDVLIPRPDGTMDTITRYVTILDSNDGSSSLSIGIADHTASCDNQFFQFYKAGLMKFRHSASIAEKIQEMPQLLELALAESLHMTEMYQKFETTKVTRTLAMHRMSTELLGHCLKDDIKGKALSNMNTLYDEMRDQMDDKGDNLWGLFSGVTSWTTHTKQAPKRKKGRLESRMTGTNYKVNQKALKLVTEMHKLISE